MDKVKWAKKMEKKRRKVLLELSKAEKEVLVLALYDYKQQFRKTKLDPLWYSNSQRINKYRLYCKVDGLYHHVCNKLNITEADIAARSRHDKDTDC